ncbi:MAG: hypothetical protein NXI00_20010 [Cytophagales bacterium]|nr:hypothetical protein [Cytophagales bacterium]
MTTIELKHGDFKANLLVCNKAMRLALMAFKENSGYDEKIIFSGNTGAVSEFLTLYVFFSYQMYCKRNKQEVEFDEFDFEEAISEKGIEKKDSNVEEVFTQVAETLTSSLKEAVEEEKKTKAQPTDGTSLKVSSAEN